MKITITDDDGVVIDQIDTNDIDGKGYHGDLPSIISIVSDALTDAFEYLKHV